MKVVFMEEVEGTARVGEVKNVADGFARNYLLPRRLAAPATDHYITIAQGRAEKEARREERLDEEAREHIVPKVEGQSLTIEVRVGEQGKLFGSVTARDIAEALQQATGVEVEHKQVDLRQPIREIGSHEVTVKLTRSVLVPVTVSVEPLGGMPEEAEAAPEEGEEEETAAAEEAAPEAEAEPAEEPEEGEAVEAEAETGEEPEAEGAEEPAEEESAEEPEPEAEGAEEPAEAEPAEEPEPEAEGAEEPAEEEPTEEPEPEAEGAEEPAEAEKPDEEPEVEAEPAEAGEEEEEQP